MTRVFTRMLSPRTLSLSLPHDFFACWTVWTLYPVFHHSQSTQIDNDIELRVANNWLRFDGTYLPSPVVYSQHLLPEKKGVEIIFFSSVRNLSMWAMNPLSVWCIRKLFGFERCEKLFCGYFSRVKHFNRLNLFLPLKMDVH